MADAPASTPQKPPSTPGQPPVRPAQTQAPAKPAQPAVAEKHAVDMKPMKASEDGGPRFLRLLVIGDPKVGKTSAVVGTSPKPVYVINTDPADGIEPAKDFDRTFLYNNVETPQHMLQALMLARELVRKGEVKTVVWDTMSGFSPVLEDEAIAATKNKDGDDNTMKASPRYRKQLRGIIKTLFKLEAHVVVISHYAETGGTELEKLGGAKKTGKKGIVPLLWGAARVEIAGLFSDIVFMEKILHAPAEGAEPQEMRVFVTSMEGVTGPGCRSLRGHKMVPAHVRKFIKIAEQTRLERQKATTKEDA